MNNWKLGDQAFIAYHQHAGFIGKRCEVVSIRCNVIVFVGVSGLREHWPIGINVDIEGEYMLRAGEIYTTPNGHEVSCTGDGHPVKPEWLRRPDEWDGMNEKYDWSLCPFKPVSQEALQILKESVAIKKSRKQANVRRRIDE